MSITFKTPDSKWLESYLEPSLVHAKAYTIDTPDVSIKLDQNESPYDWSDALKDKVLAKLKEQEWNRYPTAYAPELNKIVADYVGVGSENILLAPGSNYFCALLLSTFTKKMKGKLVIASPSFPLYEGHCRYENIPYERWPLNADLDYDRALLPELTDGSIVVFASPNNPVGNVLPRKSLELLLKENPTTLFMADEAYFEYATEPYTKLLESYSNLILIRTFSKTLGSAGIRLGYVVADAKYIAQLTKLRLPFLLNSFTLVAAETIITDKDSQIELAKTIKQTISERNRVFEKLHSLSTKGGFKPKASEANFIMVKFDSDAKCQTTYSHLIASKILVRNISKGPGLEGCLRITIGNQNENDQLLKAFTQIVS